MVGDELPRENLLVKFQLIDIQIDDSAIYYEPGATNHDSIGAVCIA